MIVNTHDTRNPLGISDLEKTLHSAGFDYQVVKGWHYPGPKPEENYPHILSGVPDNARYSATDDSFRQEVGEAYQWTRFAGVQIIGICLGWQILASVFGGEVSKLERPRYHQVSMKGCWLKENGPIHGYSMHWDYVSRVPECFMVLKYSKDGIPNVAIHREKPIIGFQPHVEKMDSGRKCLINALKEPKRYSCPHVEHSYERVALAYASGHR